MSYSTSSPRLQVSSVELEALSYPQHDLLSKIPSTDHSQQLIRVLILYYPPGDI